MSFISDIMDSVKKKHLELQERKQFLQEVENRAKPIRRVAYMQQMLKEVVNEGIEKAKADSKAKLEKQQQKEKPIDFGLSDPYKFIKSNEGGDK